MHGRLSPIPPYRSAESAALIPGARIEVVDGAGHFPWLDRPGSVRDAVDRWLDSTRQGEAAPGTLASQGEA